MPPLITNTLAIDLPPTIAPIDRPTFAIILIVTLANCLLSIILLVSRAKDDIVVKEPQNPTAASNEYFVSRFNDGKN